MPISRTEFEGAFEESRSRVLAIVERAAEPLSTADVAVAFLGILEEYRHELAADVERCQLTVGQHLTHFLTLGRIAKMTLPAILRGRTAKAGRVAFYWSLGRHD